MPRHDHYAHSMPSQSTMIMVRINNSLMKSFFLVNNVRSYVLYSKIHGFGQLYDTFRRVISLHLVISSNSLGIGVNWINL